MSDTTGSIWLHWHGHPDALIGLGGILFAYLLLTGPTRRKLGLAGESDPRDTTLFSLGILVIFLSILSPLHILSDQYLFSAHMVQHVLITLIAPPLIILGIPGWLISPILKRNKPLRVIKFIVHPVVAIITFNFIFAIWHIPELYDYSVKYHWIHVSEHILFIFSSIIMWWPLCSKSPELPRIPYPIQMIYLFVMSLSQIIVFGIITFSTEPLYDHYINAPRLWNITPLLDQQLGGIIMKVGSGFLFLFLLIIVFFKWFKESTNTVE